MQANKQKPLMELAWEVESFYKLSISSSFKYLKWLANLTLTRRVYTVNWACTDSISIYSVQSRFFKKDGWLLLSSLFILIAVSVSFFKENDWPRISSYAPSSFLCYPYFMFAAVRLLVKGKSNGKQMQCHPVPPMLRGCFILF